MHLHIYGLSGRSLLSYIGTECRELFDKESKTILFLPGCTWLVCDIHNDEEKHIKNIYIREVNLGIDNKSNVFWLDQKLLRNSYSPFHYMFNDYNRCDEA